MHFLVNGQISQINDAATVSVCTCEFILSENGVRLISKKIHNWNFPEPFATFQPALQMSLHGINFSNSYNSSAIKVCSTIEQKEQSFSKKEVAHSIHSCFTKVISLICVLLYN